MVLKFITPAIESHQEFCASELWHTRAIYNAAPASYSPGCWFASRNSFQEKISTETGGSPGRMKMSVGKHSSAAPVAAVRRRDCDAEREIDNFLRALNSYAESFAHNPLVTFEEHFFSIAGEAAAS
jgi:hypothetical protein